MLLTRMRKSPKSGGPGKLNRLGQRQGLFMVIKSTINYPADNKQGRV